MARQVTQTLRLDFELAESVALAARVEDVSFAQFVRIALSEALDARQRDPTFQQHLRETRAKHDAAFARLLAPEARRSGP